MTNEHQPTTAIILTPQTAAEAVCHDEQMIVWASDFVGMLSLGDYLRELDYSEGVDLTEAVKRELRSIIDMAFNHSDVQTLMKEQTP